MAALPPGAEDVVEFDREGGGVGAVHLSGLGLYRVRRHDDRSLRDADLVAATVFGLARASSPSSFFFFGVKFEDAARRTWCARGGRRLASSCAFRLEAVRLRLGAAVGLSTPGAPSSIGGTMLGVVGASLRLGCASPRSERPS